MSQPRRLSAGPVIVWTGRILPIAMVLVLIAVFLSGPLTEWTFNRAIAALFLVTVVGAVAWFQFRAVSSDVVDHGEHLVITANGKIEQIHLSAIGEVQYKPVMLGNVVTLYFRTAGPLGSSVSYVPASGFRRSTQQEVDELRRRVLQAGIIARA